MKGQNERKNIAKFGNFCWRSYGHRLFSSRFENKMNAKCSFFPSVVSECSFFRKKMISEKFPGPGKEWKKIHPVPRKAFRPRIVSREWFLVFRCMKL